MTTLNNDKGFSLVELAISVMVIGILIGGVVKGREVLDSSRIAALSSQISKYEKAVTSFEDLFGMLPGDMDDPAANIPGCATASNGKACTFNDADSLAGDNDGLIEGAAAFSTADTTSEGRGFWEHLTAAGMMTDTQLKPGTTNAISKTHPTTAFGGWVSVVYVGSQHYFRATRTNTTAGSGTGIGAASTSLIMPAQAKSLDRKLDDGIANQGRVQGHGQGTTCLNGQNYSVATATKACELLFKFL